MKNHAPIKRHQALVSYSKEHHFGLLLVWKIRQGLMNAVSPERIGKYVLFFFNEDLKTHFKEEEQLLFCKRLYVVGSYFYFLISADLIIDESPL